MTDARRALDTLERVFRERGYTLAMAEQARDLAASIGVAPPAWASNGSSPAPRPSTGGEWHQAKRDEQLQREWERWRYQRSKLPPDKRGPMMEVGQRQCKWCEGFFEPSTLRQRYCKDTCRKLAHKRRAA